MRALGVTDDAVSDVCSTFGITTDEFDNLPIGIQVALTVGKKRIPDNPEKATLSIGFGVNAKEGLVMINFGEPIDQFALDTDQLANLIEEMQKAQSRLIARMSSAPLAASDSNVPDGFKAIRVDEVITPVLAKALLVYFNMCPDVMDSSVKNEIKEILSEYEELFKKVDFNLDYAAYLLISQWVNNREQFEAVLNMEARKE